MRSAEFKIVVCLLILIVGVSTAFGGQDEQGALLEQQKELRNKITVLKQEQDYLLFRNRMAASDSRYIVLDLAKKTGQLLYKNRVLRDFPFTLPDAKSADVLPRGAVALTKKIEGPDGRYVLRFGTAFVVQWKRLHVPPAEASLPVVSLSKNDIRSIFFALEPGSTVYLLR